MKEPVWLTERLVAAFHSATVRENGGSHGIRDKGLLESALNRPQHQFHYSKLNIFELAAAYAYGIIKNYPFMDGNKRTGIICCGVFLSTHGFALEVDETALVEKTVALATDLISEKDFSIWLEENSKKIKSHTHV